MLELKIDTNLKKARFGIAKSRLTLTDEPDCAKCSIGRARKKLGEDTPLFTAKPNPPEGAVSRLMIIGNFAVSRGSCLVEAEKQLVLEGLKLTKFDYVYVSPAIKCTHNKAPTKPMMSCCEELLRRELEVVKPTVIVCIGKAVTSFFNISGKITKLTSMIFDGTCFPGQEKWGYSPKIMITEDISKVLDDVKLRTGFISTFAKADKFKMPNTENKSGIISYQQYESADELKADLDKIENGLKTIKRPFVIGSADIETTGKGPHVTGTRMRTISFTFAEGRGKCIPVELDYEGYLPLIKRLFLIDKIHWIWFNATFDMHYLHWVYGIDVKHFFGDVMHMAYLLDPTKGAYGYALKTLCQEHTTLGAYDTELHEDESELDKETGISIWERTPLEIVAPYNCCDVDGTLRLCTIFMKRLRELGMGHLVELMANAARPIIEMEMNGLPINAERRASYVEMLTPLVAKYSAECKEHAGGREVDWGSPAQVSKLLFVDLGYAMPPGSKKDGDTGEDTLRILNTPLTNAILKFRRASKYLNTYMLGYFNPDKLDEDGRLRGRFHQVGTRTGRLSSTDPNLQNLTKGIHKGDPAFADMKDINIKSVIEAPPGWVLVQADLSQAEMRIATCASRDKTLMEAYTHGLDMHSLNAKSAFGIKKDLTEIIKAAIAEGLKEGTKEYEIYVLRRELSLIKEENGEERTASKSISFGILYAMTARGLQFDLNMKTLGTRVWTLEECQGFINEFKRSYPQLTRYLAKCQSDAKKTGYVVNLFNRYRWLPNINNRENWKLRGKDLNAAVNTPIQGGSSDLMMCGMYDMWSRLDLSRALPLMTVHDSIVLMVMEDYVREAAKITQYALQNPTFQGKPLPFLAIPIVSDIEIGKNYGKMKEVKNLDNVPDVVSDEVLTDFLAGKIKF